MPLYSLDNLEFSSIRDFIKESCVTALGKNLALSLNPINDFSVINELLIRLRSFRILLQQNVDFSFGCHSEIDEELLSLQLRESVLDAKVLFVIASALRSVATAQQLLGEHLEDHPALLPIAEQLECPYWIADKVLASVDYDGQILDGASPELKRLRATYRKAFSTINQTLKRYFDEKDFPNYVQDDFITIRSGRMVIPIKIEHKNRFHGIMHDRSRGGDSIFFEPEEAVELNNSLSTIQGEIRLEEARILAEMTAYLYQSWDEIIDSFRGMAELDFLRSKAKFADLCDGVAPTLSNEAELKIEAARHPLLDERLHKLRISLGMEDENSSSQKIVPTDINLGSEWDILTITGPNAGGKTVSLKTAGLLALMAQAGLHVPAKSYTGPVYQVISADIGDTQDIMSHLSTFSSHVHWLRNTMLNLKTPALILVDEIASATDPAEGSALAMAVLEQLRNEGAHVIITTHLEALKAFAHGQDRMQNGCVEFDPKSLRPTFHLSYGLPGKSNALETAKEVGLPQRLMDRAYYYMGDEGAKTSEVIAKLQEELTIMKEQRHSLEAEQKRMEAARNHYVGKLDEAEERAAGTVEAIQKEWREYKRKQDKQIETAIVEAKEAAKQNEKDLQEKQRNLQEKRKEREVEFKELKLQKKKRKKAVADDSPLAVGDNVLLIEFQQKGKVLSEWSDGNNGVNIDVNGIRMSLPRSAMRKVEGQAKRPGGNITYRMDSVPVRHELKLIGLRVADALDELDRFLDDAMVNNLGKVSIIHGRGTGRLRAAIEEHLREQEYVSQWSKASSAEGGDAVTLVELIN